MIIVVAGSEPAESRSIATLQMEGVEFSTTIHDAEEVLRKCGPERKLIVTYAPASSDVTLLLATIKNDNRLNYLVLTGLMSEDEITLAQGLVRSSPR